MLPSCADLRTVPAHGPAVSAVASQGRPAASQRAERRAARSSAPDRPALRSSTGPVAADATRSTTARTATMTLPMRSPVSLPTCWSISQGPRVGRCRCTARASGSTSPGGTSAPARGRSTPGCGTGVRSTSRIAARDGAMACDSTPEPIPASRLTAVTRRSLTGPRPRA